MDRIEAEVQDQAAGNHLSLSKLWAAGVVCHARKVAGMMETSDPRVDAYIAKSTDFAQPILAYLREIVHDACPEVEETIKWGMPHFMYRGNLCSMTAFKQHCAFDAFSPSHKREYVEWLSEAKSEGTRQRRLNTAIEWLAEGKPRNWKYIKT